MASHSYVFSSEDSLYHKFSCTFCGQEVWFVKEGAGTPNAVLDKNDKNKPPELPQEFYAGEKNNKSDSCDQTKFGFNCPNCKKDVQVLKLEVQKIETDLEAIK